MHIKNTKHLENTLLPAESTAALFLLCIKKSVNMVTHEPLRFAWRNYEWTCTSTISQTLLNIKVIGQRSRLRVFLCVSCLDDTAWTSWPRFTTSHSHSLNGATLLMPADGTRAISWAVLSLEQGLTILLKMSSVVRVIAPLLSLALYLVKDLMRLLRLHRVQVICLQLQLRRVPLSPLRGNFVSLYLSELSPIYNHHYACVSVQRRMLCRCFFASLWNVIWSQSESALF